jgi:two-component system, chemotaxis family, response regulator Rcp1
MTMTIRLGKPIEILLVEDSLGDVRLVQEALQEAKVRNHMIVMEDGEEALAFLYKKGKYAKSVTPGLVLLDLNLPKKNGFEVLQEVKADEKLKHIPVVVLTTSQSEQDIVKSYDLNANAYVSKPVDLNQFLSVVKAIEGFWLEIVKLPEGK